MIPIFDTDLIKEKIVAHLGDAKKSIEIAMAWFTDTDLERAVLAAVRRGVQVSVVLHDDKINRESRIDWNVLCAAGVSLHWYTSEEGTMHHKFCVVDKRFCLFGTYNWTYYASKFNRETFCVLDNDIIASIFRLEFRDLLKYEFTKFHVSINKTKNLTSREKLQQNQALIDEQKKSKETALLSKQIVPIDKNKSLTEETAPLSKKVVLVFERDDNEPLQREVNINIEKLELRNKRIKTLPIEIGQLINLTSLDLSGNQLTQLRAEIGKLTNLTSLCLGKNQLTQFPTEIGNLTNLTSLDLEKNQLRQLPTEIGNLINLTYLDLENNQLTQLPAEIWKLTNLKELHLNQNELTQLPAEIGNLINLTHLILKDNQLTQLPIEIEKFTNLIKLYLGNNHFSDDEKERIKALLPKCLIEF